MNSLPLYGADEIERFGYRAATDALEHALLAGLDVDADPPRQVLPIRGGEMLVMPSAVAGRPLVKAVTVGSDPWVQGVCVAFDPLTLAPAALIDGPALTLLRTAAMSALAARHLATPCARHAVVFGRGPQGRAHADALLAVLPIDDVVLVGREAAGGRDAVAAADIVCCCTTSDVPVFDGRALRDDATVIAIGSHRPAARETDDVVVQRATVVVESRTTALREAGDVVTPIRAGMLQESDLVELGDVLRGAREVDPKRPRMFKSTGMAWQDAVVADAVLTQPAARRAASAWPVPNRSLPWT